jgi:hypothetical protein
MLRIEIIAQIEAEIGRLERARDILAGAPANGKKAFGPKAKRRNFGRKGNQPKRAAVRGPNSLEGQEIAASTPPDPGKGPSVQVLPPRRRIERHKRGRAVSSQKAGMVRAALSGLLPSGPVAVSANEARKAEARNSTPPPPQVESEVTLDTNSERSLGALVRAFERSSRMSGIGTA